MRKPRGNVSGMIERKEIGRNCGHGLRAGGEVGYRKQCEGSKDGVKGGVRFFTEVKKKFKKTACLVKT